MAAILLLENKSGKPRLQAVDLREWYRVKNQEKIVDTFALTGCEAVRVGWMRKICKFYMKNHKLLSHARADWEKLEIYKRR